MFAQGPRGVSRRHFLAAGAVAAGVSPTLLAQVASPEAAAEIDLDTFVLPRRDLGQTGLRPTVLGFGTGKFGPMYAEDGSRENFRRLVSLLEYAYDRGIRYFDLADDYDSHPFMRAALRENGGTIPRGEVVLLTKTLDRTHSGALADIERFRREVGTDHLDIVLYHAAEAGDWPAIHRGALDALSEAKAARRVRAHGSSCHTIAALAAAAAEPWVEVDLARLNPWSDIMDGPVETVKGVLRTMKHNGKGVIGMKILANGRRAAAPERAESIRHALTCGLLDCFTIGFRTREELDQVLLDVAVGLRGARLAAPTAP